MNEPQNREEEIFEAALQLPVAERAAYLDRACAGDGALRQRVELLLKAHEQNVNALDNPPVMVAKTMQISTAIMPVTEQPGQNIGRYKLREKIGEGGCGVVYVADQEEPVRRRVALKIVKLGMDTRQVVARFEAERQVLALMDHPNIAKVLDGGATDTGRPYFVMELVRGIRITDYCDQNNLSTEERLKLFIQVCKAVQHAHQKGIIHRDIKPSNVLVTLHDGVPVPKVIDFGIAKATGEQRLTDKTIYTAFEQFIGTPAYMSPEQAEMSGLDIDTRSDIYSLGVLLYELLTGRPPFDPETLMHAGIDQMRRIIREKEPARPSTSLATFTSADLTTAASRRRLEPSKLIQSIQGDLDWIVMKLLEKDRTRRYETANGVAADIQRHLDNEPVSARPPSQLYRLQRILRRNRMVVNCLLFVFFFTLFLAVGDGMRKYRHSEQERRVLEIAQGQARENFEQARAAVADMLAVADEDLYDVPGMQPLRVKLMRAAIDRFQPLLEQSSADPALRSEMGQLYLKYGFAAKEIGGANDYTNIALPAYNSALAIRRQLVKEHPENRFYRSELGWTLVYARLWHDITGIETNQPQAVAIFEGLAREDPADPFARLGLAWALGISVERYYTNDPAWLEKADRRLALLEQLAKEFPRSVEFRRDLANELDWYPGPGESNSDSAAKLARKRRAEELRKGILADLEKEDPAIRLPARPKDSVARLLRPSLVFAKLDLGFGWLSQSRVLAELKRWPEAVSMAGQATAMGRDLSEQSPSVKLFAFLLNRCFSNEVAIAELAGDAAGAQTHRLEAENFWRAHPAIERPGQ